ncbi:MAG: D-aminoacyl-tRNA deacylase [Bacteroidota bacterium]
MRIIIQRVKKASVTINDKLFSEIENGLLVLLGVEDADGTEDIEWLANKLVSLRIFSDEKGLMNLSVKDIDGGILLVSQFTLFASTKKGNRPSFIRSAKPEIAIPLYEKFIIETQKLIAKPIKTGVFGADMQIELINDGPVTIVIDSKNRE